MQCWPSRIPRTKRRWQVRFGDLRGPRRSPLDEHPWHRCPGLPGHPRRIDESPAVKVIAAGRHHRLALRLIVDMKPTAGESIAPTGDSVADAGGLSSGRG